MGIAMICMKAAAHEINFNEQYKPIKFRDRPDPDSVGGHRERMAEDAETRAYTRTQAKINSIKWTA